MNYAKSSAARRCSAISAARSSPTGCPSMTRHVPAIITRSARCAPHRTSAASGSHRTAASSSTAAPAASPGWAASAGPSGLLSASSGLFGGGVLAASFSASTARSDTFTPALMRDRRLRATRDGRAFGRSRGARGCVKDRARRPQTEERPRRSIGLCRGATRAPTQGPRPEPRPSVATRPGSRCNVAIEAPGPAPMRKTFAVRPATSGTGCPTREDCANRGAFQLTSQRNNLSRPPLRRQTIDYLDQTAIDYRDHSQ